MNEPFISPPPPPDDETQDPLLRALRQQLGAGFGQEPPPGLWSGIREQLPVAQPWWRGRRFLLPLLALLLLSTGALWQAGRLHRAGLRAGGLASARPAGSERPPVGSRLPAAARRPGAGPATNPPTTRQPATSPALDSPAGVATTALPRPGNSSAALATATKAKTERAGAPEGATGRPTLPGAAPGRYPLARKLAAHSAAAATRQPMKAELLAASRRPDGRRVSRSAALPAEAAGGSSHSARVAARRPVAAPADSGANNQARQTRRDGIGGRSQLLARQPEGQPLTLGAAGRAQAGRAGAVPADSAALAPAGALALLGGRLAGVRLPRLGLPVPLAATDVPGPLLAPGRRWAVQVLAGPSLSYRTARRAAGGAALSYATGPVLSDSSEVGFEQPALGWGAQVQARRVLAGRWALAAGLGYQEYATRLALDVTTYAPNPTAMAVLGTITAVRQRDTYRLLTVPVQLSYLLGPRGPWQLGVLGGAEPGLYLSGRTTENSGCNCQQQTFASAAGSPYNAWSLALSLGLDVRLRLGGPAARWQLLAQPTGRYVATPFVRSEAYGYAQRQPYGLGLLLGAAWEW